MIIIGSLVAITAMLIVTLFQMGIIPHLPDPPGAVFNSDKVNSSEQAYRFGLPDGTLVVLSLAATIILAAFGGIERAQ